MSFKIVVDSCCELPEEYLQDSRFEIVPLGLEVGDYQIQDDENFDQAEFLKKVAECPKCPKSACPIRIVVRANKSSKILNISQSSI